jgi:gamma-glutamyltranspeptidase / glutathione hydrolase
MERLSTANIGPRPKPGVRGVQRALRQSASKSGNRSGLRRKSLLVRIVLVGLLVGLLAVISRPHPAQAQRGTIAPEAATGREEKRLVTADRQMVVAANPLAVDAGLAMLRAGGSAVDAAIATQLVLNLVEPQSSGLGGGAFVLHWDRAKRELVSYDGRETAPMAATPDRFLVGGGINGSPMPFGQAVASGLSVGVPGTARLAEDMHKRHGRLPWDQLFAPALKLAEDGFAVSSRLHLLLVLMGAESFSPAARDYFFDASFTPHAVGYVLKNPAFAATLKTLRDGGADAFYSGATARAMVEAVAAAPRPGDLTAADLAGYKVVLREPLCVPYRSYQICGMAPPSSGGIAVAQTLKLLEAFSLGRGPKAALNNRAMHLIAEAEKLAFADRDRYIADPEFVVPPEGLLDDTYLGSRRTLINEQAAMAKPAAGVPPPSAVNPPGWPPKSPPKLPGKRAELFGDDATIESVGTSHISIVDSSGNAVSMTTTIEAGFGSRLFAGGFLLNNEMTDFSFRPTDDQGRAIANAVAPGKRPRSSMAPTLVFDAAGDLKAVVGSPGGSRIILYVVKALVGLIDWQLDPQTASGLVNFGSRGGAMEIEFDPSLLLGARPDAGPQPWLSPPSSWYALRQRRFGHSISRDLMTSGLHLIWLQTGQAGRGKIIGGADPRREGVARGD